MGHRKMEIGRPIQAEQSVKLVPEGVESMKEIAAVLTRSDRAKICDPNRVIVPPVPIPAVRPTDVARR